MNKLLKNEIKNQEQQQKKIQRLEDSGRVEGP